MILDTRRMDHSVAPLIEGELTCSRSGATVDVINPANSRRLLSIPAGCDADVDRAVASARRAFDDGRWSEAPPSVRKATLHRLADLISQESSALDALDAEEMGKPVSVAVFNAADATRRLRFFAEAVDKVMGDVYASDKQSFVVQRRVPRGVVAAVVPWNFPTYNVVLKVAPALAAGNSVVLKPSELASRSAMRIARLALQAGLPPGVLNVVPGIGATVGKALGLHMNVDMMSFTGSTAIGKLMVRYAGESNLKVVIAECGGKSPQIVFDNAADVAAAGEAIANLILTNQGQICSVGSRLLVQRSIEEKLLDSVIERMKRNRMGDPLDAATTFGPLVSAKQCARVMRYIESAPAEGAELVMGGKQALPESGGYFVEPTVFRSVSPGARIAQEEIFGPVLSVIPFDDEAHAVRIANSTMYGLAAYVWTADLSTGMRMANSLRSPVFINAAARLGEGAGYAASFEPARQSGFGVEGGLAGMESYQRRQVVWINHA